MKDRSEPRKKDRRQYTFNITLAAVAGQVGCLTVGVIIGSLLAGLWLDNRFDMLPLFTITFLIISMPVTLIMMYKFVIAATSRIKFDLPEEKDSPSEEVEVGRKDS